MKIDFRIFDNGFFELNQFDYFLSIHLVAKTYHQEKNKAETVSENHNERMFYFAVKRFAMNGLRNGTQQARKKGIRLCASR